MENTGTQPCFFYTPALELKKVMWTHQFVISVKNLLDFRMKNLSGTHTNRVTVVTYAMDTATTSQYAVVSPDLTNFMREANRSRRIKMGTHRHANCSTSYTINLTILMEGIINEFVCVCKIPKDCQWPFPTDTRMTVTLDSGHCLHCTLFIAIVMKQSCFFLWCWQSPLQTAN